MDHWIDKCCSYNFAAGSFYTKKVCSRRFSTEFEIYWKNSKIAILCHPLGDLGVTYTVHQWLVGKRVIDFLLVLIDFFSPGLTVEALWANIGRNCAVWKRVGHFECKFQGKGGGPPTNFGVRKLSLGYHAVLFLSLIHIWRCRRSYACRSRWSPYH